MLNYPLAMIRLRPGERQLWRILNASAITYLDLQLLVSDQLQALGVVALDGAPIGSGADQPVLWQSHALVPPAGRIEILVKGPAEGAKASLVTRTVDTGPAGENDPTRLLATVIGDPAAPGVRTRLDAAPHPSSPATARACGGRTAGGGAQAPSRDQDQVTVASVAQLIEVLKVHDYPMILHVSAL